MADMADTDALKSPLPFPDDPPYHLIRLQQIADGTVSFPAELGTPDAFIAHPFGETCIWPWGFDFLIGVTAPLNDWCGTDCMAKAAGFIPPILSGLSMILLFFLSRLAGRGSQLQRTDESRSLVAAAIFALMPANVVYTLNGRIDHHVMEPLILILPLLLVFKWNQSPAGGRGRMLLFAGGLACGLAGAFVPAAPALNIPLFIAVGTFLCLSAKPRLLINVLMWNIGMLAGTAASLFFSPFPGQWVFYSASLTHLMIAFCCIVGLVVAAAILSLTPQPDKSSGVKTRLLIAGAAGSAGGAVSVMAASWLFPEFTTSILNGTIYTASGDLAKMSLEASSFFDSPVRVLELTGWLLPLSIAGIIGAASGRKDSTERLIAVLAAIFILLAMMQRRFLVAATPLVAITAADGIFLVTGYLSRKAARISERGGAIVLVAILVPSIMTDLTIEPLTARDRAMYSAAAGIRELTGGQQKSSGTLAPWGYGHLLKYRAGVPTVCDNFFGVPGSDAAIMRCLNIMYSTNDAFINKQFDELKIRFVVLVPPHPDQIKVETGLIGLDSSAWADDEGRLSALFAQSFYGRTGMWAAGARIGQIGPWNLTLKGKFKQIDTETREVLSEVFLLERFPANAESGSGQAPTEDNTPVNH
jgi:asparagine N-glycosylation enzyme membrane subunit Stt3